MRSTRVLAWGLLYAGVGLIGAGVLLGDPRAAYAYGPLTMGDVETCYQEANRYATANPGVDRNRTLSRYWCACLCTKRWDPRTEQPQRSACLTKCNQDVQPCAGDQACNPKNTNAGSITTVCQYAGLSLATPCGGKCDGGTPYCSGCGCLKTTSANDPQRNNACLCQYQPANF